MDDLESERVKLKAQLQVVSKKISELIMEKSPSYSKQMEEFDIIRDDLKELLQDVKIIRKYGGRGWEKDSLGLWDWRSRRVELPWGYWPMRRRRDY